MPYVSAICENSACLRVFASGIYIESSTDTSVSGGSAGACPDCQSLSRYISGTYNDLADVFVGHIERLDDLEALRRVQSILQNAVDTGDTSQLIKKLQDATPATWRNLWSLLPENDEKNALLIVAALLSAIPSLGLLGNAVMDDGNTVGNNAHYNIVCSAPDACSFDETTQLQPPQAAPPTASSSAPEKKQEASSGTNRAFLDTYLNQKK